jgi:hypothetical protein
VRILTKPRRHERSGQKYSKVLSHEDWLYNYPYAISTAAKAQLQSVTTGSERPFRSATCRRTFDASTGR